MGPDEHAYQTLVAYTQFCDQEYAVGKIQEVKYPKEVEEKKVALLCNFNPLLESGAEHQLFYEEVPPEEQRPRGSSPNKGKGKKGQGR